MSRKSRTLVRLSGLATKGFSLRRLAGVCVCLALLDPHRSEAAKENKALRRMKKNAIEIAYLIDASTAMETISRGG